VASANADFRPRCIKGILAENKRPLEKSGQAGVAAHRSAVFQHLPPPVCSSERGLGMELSYEHELFGANPHLLMLLGAGLRQVRAAQGTRRPV
jgi:hypothetical protein